jgi:glycosyltransferase involved in cell wall biosynthesis
MLRKLLVAVPAYNCRDQIGRVIRQFTPSFAPLYSEVVVIDNQSRDDTAAVAADAIHQNPTMPMLVMRNRENYGLGGTHKVAFERCIEMGYDGVVILHGDDQGQIADFADIHQEIERTGASCVLGARFQPGARISGYPATRMLGNHAFNAIYSACVGQRVYDMGSGLNYYDASLIRTGLHFRMPDDLTFNNCMLLATYAKKLPVAFKPISWREEDQISNAKLVSQSRKLLKYLALYMRRRERFLTDDFRDNRRNAYPSDIIAANASAKDRHVS